MQFEWDRRGKPHVPTSSWYVSLLFIQTSIDLTCLNSVELQLCPESAPFKLPAFANGDVQTWMKTTFRTELVALRAAAGSPVDLARLQSEVLQRAPGENWSLLRDQVKVEKLMQLMQQRTAVLLPAQEFSMQTHS